MDIRRVNEKDFDDILNLQLQLEDVEIKFDCNLKERCYQTIKGKEKLKNRIANENNIFYVAMNENNKIIAFVDRNIPNDEWWYKDSVAYLNHICVDEKYRNRGVGKMLLKQFEKTTYEKGAKYVRLLAFCQNDLAISFYKNNGFVEYSTYYNKKLSQKF